MKYVTEDGLIVVTIARWLQGEPLGRIKKFCQK
jgi:hypothetical protein